MKSLKEEYLTVNEVAELLKVHRSTVERWIKAGRIVFAKLPGGDVRIKKEFFDNWIDKRTVKAINAI
jgi:excisionase family DNA binding protein